MDVFSAAQRSEIMRRVRSEDTKPEMVVRKLVHNMGFRYRLHRADLPGRPDIVLAMHKKVIFVHGCFWHQHSCKSAKLPKSNRRYWLAKQAGNATRDRRNLQTLRRSGWKVMVIWECQTKYLERLRRRLTCFLRNRRCGREN